MIHFSLIALYLVQVAILVKWSNKSMVSYWVSENLAKLFNVLFSSVLLPFFIWFNRDLKVSRYLFAYSLSFISLQGSNGLLKVSNLIEWLDFLYT